MKARSISPETVPQVLDQPGENVSSPTPGMHRKPNDSFKLEDILKELSLFWPAHINSSPIRLFKTASLSSLSESTSSRIIHQCQCLYVRVREELLAGRRWLVSHFFFFLIRYDASQCGSKSNANNLILRLYLHQEKLLTGRRWLGSRSFLSSCGEYARYGASQCGSKSNADNLILRLCLHQYLHAMSLWRHKNSHNTTKLSQALQPWWRSCSPLQLCVFFKLNSPIPTHGWPGRGVGQGNWLKKFGSNL